jgi:hypothetical protein
VASDMLHCSLLTAADSVLSLTVTDPLLLTNLLGSGLITSADMSLSLPGPCPCVILTNGGAISRAIPIDIRASDPPVLPAAIAELTICSEIGRNCDSSATRYCPPFLYLYRTANLCSNKAVHLRRSHFCSTALYGLRD